MLSGFFKRKINEESKITTSVEVVVDSVNVEKVQMNNKRNIKQKRPYALSQLMTVLRERECQNLIFYAALNNLRDALLLLNSSDISQDLLNKMQSISFEIEDKDHYIENLDIERLHKIKLILTELSGKKTLNIELVMPLRVEGFLMLYFWNQLIMQPKIYYSDLASDYYNMTHSVPDRTYSKQCKLSPSEVRNKLDKYSSIWEKNVLEHPNIHKVLDALSDVVSNI